MRKILVTGSKGQLGSELNYLIKKEQKSFWNFLDSEEFNLLELDNIYQKLANYNPDVIINCAAYTNVDKAEEDEKNVNIINHLAVKFISKWCFQNNKKLIHISTDYVFDGTSIIPLKESSSTNPINIYGKTKLLGDLACVENCPDSIIIRTSWVFSSFGNNFLKTMINLMSEKNELNIISDQIGSPTYARDLASAIIEIIEFKEWHSGIYNYSNEGKISWYEFAMFIKEIYPFNTKLIPIKTSDYITLAKRPKYSLLDKSKIKETYKINIPHYTSSIINCINLLKNEK